MLAIPPADFALDDFAMSLLDRLRLFGDVQVYVIAESCGGECDPRLGICRDHPAVTVELLCDQEGELPPPHWHAVRVAGDERCVWRGPHRGCDPTQVVQFIDDLLRMHPRALTERYRLLG